MACLSYHLPTDFIGMHVRLMTKINPYFCIMETQRQQKINKLLQRDLSEIFQIEMRSVVPGVMVTVTKVVITSDLSIARVYLSIFATKKKMEQVEKIRTCTREIRGHLGKRVGSQLRIIPNLQFFLDDSLDYLENIDNLLKNS